MIITGECIKKRIIYKKHDENMIKKCELNKINKLIHIITGRTKNALIDIVVNDI